MALECAHRQLLTSLLLPRTFRAISVGSMYAATFAKTGLGVDPHKRTTPDGKFDIWASLIRRIGLHATGGYSQRLVLSWKQNIGSGGRDRTADLGVMNPRVVLVPASYGEKAQ